MTDPTAIDHFPIEEFRCHDGHEYPSEWITERLTPLKLMLEVIRAAWAGMGAQNPALIVVSGYRTLEYNARIGGAKLSQHCQGRAADIRPVDINDVEALYTLIRHKAGLDVGGTSDIPQLGGLGIYPGWVHVDVRPITDHIAQWTGNGIGSEA